MTNRTQQAQNRSWKRNRRDGILKKSMWLREIKTAYAYFFSSVSRSFHSFRPPPDLRLRSTPNDVIERQKTQNTREIRESTTAQQCFVKFGAIDEHRTRFVSILLFEVPAVSFYPVWLPPVPGVFSPVAGVSFRFRSPVFPVPAASS